MKVGNWKGGFEAIGLIAIVASLVFVGFQLRQDQLIARSELTSDSFHLMIAMNQSLIGPEFASTYAKMLDRPEGLSLDEMVQIDNLFTAVKTMYLEIIRADDFVTIGQQPFAQMRTDETRAAGHQNICHDLPPSRWETVV